MYVVYMYTPPETEKRSDLHMGSMAGCLLSPQATGSSKPAQAAKSAARPPTHASRPEALAFYEL